MRWSAENFIRENARCDFVERKHSIREKREDIIAICLVLQKASQSGGRLEISGAFFLDKNRVKDIQSRSLRHSVVGLFIDENEERIAQTINLGALSPLQRFLTEFEEEEVEVGDAAGFVDDAADDGVEGFDAGAGDAVLAEVEDLFLGFA